MPWRAACEGGRGHAGGVKAPAALVEMGYISRSKDRARLNNNAAQKRMGKGIEKGIVSYLQVERKISVK